MSETRCPINGLTPAAQVEMDAFEDHLHNHRTGDVVGCRFCEFRSGDRKALVINAERAK